MPKDRKATYVRIVCADRPEKEEQRRVRFTVGRDQVNYPGAVSTKTADLAMAKILLNSVLSTPGAKYMTGDLKDFYLNTPMEWYEYVRLPIKIIPPISIIEHDLLLLVHIKDASTLRSAEACTDYPKPDALPMTNSRRS
jgi:hypothetical protein